MDSFIFASWFGLLLSCSLACSSWAGTSTIVPAMPTCWPGTIKRR
uniref:Uncharacterized protein n=1 Tax=Setaria viridis TaxID=4556 RepID=A0A4U6UHR3_SETVI|nr:hypothetical protein SEVIR_5G260533v2 [Setaria viridis]